MARPSSEVRDAAAELRLVIGQLVRRLRAEYAFPLTHASVLSRLERDGALTTSALAAGERVRPQSMAQTLAELESHGLVSRRPHPSDKRQVLIELTAAGTERLAEMRGRREDWLAGQIAALEPEEQQTLLAAVPLLRRVSS